MPNSDFIEEILQTSNISSSHPIVLYLRKKTKAADRDSKARKSLGNLYALYVLAEDYNLGKNSGSKFTELLKRMKEKPFGSKLQNHPLDNRLNDEFKRVTGLGDKYLPVVSETIDKNKARRISKDLLESNSSNPREVSKFITDTIDLFIQKITSSQDNFLKEIENCNKKEKLIELFEKCVAPKSDARLFEIFSFSILNVYYRKFSVTFSVKDSKTFEGYLTLYKTGRTNANDGGIDFIMRPTGRVFQVTETYDFKKYFLDIDKLNRYPISFVIKTEDDERTAKSKIRLAAKEMNNKEKEIYLSLFEEIITIKRLREIFFELIESRNNAELIKENLTNSFRLEFGFYD